MRIGRAAYAAGLFFSTYKNPYAMVIQDTSGFVGVGTNAPQAALDVQPNTNYCTHCPVARLGSFTIDYAGNTNVSGDFNSSSVFTGYLDVSGPIKLTGSYGIFFPDGTVQTTAYTGAAAVKQATAMQQLQRDRDSLAQLVRQLQTRVDRLQRSRR